MFSTPQRQTNIVLAHAGTYRTVQLSYRSMGPRVREDDVGLGFRGVKGGDF